MKSGLVFLFLLLSVAVSTSLEFGGDPSLPPPPQCGEIPSLLHAMEGFSIVVHRNGESDSCAAVSFKNVRQAYADTVCDVLFSKYHLESFLTHYIATELLENDNACGSTDDTTTTLPGLYGYCDGGPERTVIQEDSDRLVPTPHKSSLPCRWFSREGQRVSQLSQLFLMKKSEECTAADSTPCDDDDEHPTLHLYAVPAGRVFMFAASFVGEQFSLDHVKDADGKIVTMKVLSTSPRVFDITHFFNKEESDSLVQSALEQTDEVFGFHRSTTGTTGASVFNKRTSENAWDTSGDVALAVKRRCFRLLGFDEYHEPLSDGLQILRYNLTTAYTPHMDYLEDRDGSESYDYDSAGKGGNRFATILLYFTELQEGDGGETVFPKAWPADVPAEQRVPITEAIQQLRDSGEAASLTKGSWEERMAAECRTRLSVRPTAQRAVLFYSQHPNGEQDPMSFHGGCPVLRGTKLAANLWTWSGIRPEFQGAPRKFEETPVPAPQQVAAVFENRGTDSAFQNAELFYNGEVSFGNIGHGDTPVYVNTFEGHVWHVKVNGEVQKTFTIGDAEKQTFQV